MGKRGGDDDTDGPPQKRGRGKGGGKAGGSVVFKALLPDLVMVNLIGHGGQTRKQLEESTGARIKISSRDDVYPGTRLRYILMTADDSDKVLAACDQVLDQIIEFANQERDGRGKAGRPPADETLIGKEPGEFVFRAAMPKECTGKLIGAGGSHIKALREETGAKVFIENETQEMHQLTRCIGDQEALRQVLPRLLEVIEGELSEDKRTEWSKISFVGAKGNGKEAGASSRKGEGRSDRGRDRDQYENRDDCYPRHDDRWSGHAQHQRHGGRGHHGGTDPLDLIADMTSQFPDGALDMPHAVHCDLPSNTIGNLIGRKAEFVREVESATGTQVKFSEAPRRGEARTLSITGPLIAVYAAHMMMMKRYHEGEASPEKESPKIQELQSQLADLQRQLNDAKSAPGGGKGKGKR